METQNQILIFCKGLLLGLLLLVFCPAANGQQFNYHRDFQQLLAHSQDSNSSLYYPKLLRRFNQNDSTLTDTEVLALQIGYTAKAAYLPFKTVHEEGSIKQLVAQEKYEQALKVCDKLLRKNPLNLTALMGKSLIYWKFGQDSLDYYRHKQLKLVSAVLASGDGTAEQPFFVLSPLDGQSLIVQVLGGSVGSMGSSIDANDYYLDMLEFKKAGREPQMLYFNISHATAKLFSDAERAVIQQVLEEDDVLSKSRKKQ